MRIQRQSHNHEEWQTDIDLSKENPFKTTWLSPGSQIKSYVSASVTGLHSLESEVDILLVDLLNTD